MRVRRLAAILIAAGCLAACGGGGGGGGGGGVATFTVSVNVTGLSGSGLVLQLNGAGNLSVGANGFFTFSTRLSAGTPYSVTVLTYPASPTQACSLANATGTIAAGNVGNVGVNCTNGFTIGGTVSGMSGAGLVLQNNGGGNLPISANGPFTFAAPVASGAAYNVTVFSPTPTQTCAVTSGSGNATINVNNVAVNCTLGFAVDASSGPLVSQQWHLKNTGQNAFADSGGVANMDINVEPAFGAGSSGLGVIAAVVDSGLEIAHEDLAANVVPNGSWNFNNNTTDPTNPATDGDHGTMVSGLIAMARNSLGGIGVAPSASLKGFNFLSSTQSGTQFVDSLGGSTSNPNSSDVFVFNQSFGITTNTPVHVDPLEESVYLSGVTSLRGAKGALYVKAGGNGFNSVGTVNCTGTGLTCENANFDPGNTLPYQIVVGAFNANGIRASYSTAGSAIWVSAPGGEFGRNVSVHPGFPANDYEPAMVTTDQSGCAKGESRTGVNTSVFDNGGAFNTSCNYTNGMNGSSSATPVTVGVIALMLEANPALTWRDVKHILASTARQFDPARAAVTVLLPNPAPNSPYVAEPAWTTNHATPTPFHYHNWYGFGAIDASAAVNMARTYVSALGTFTNTGFIPSATLSIPIPDQSATGASNGISVPAGPVSVIEAVQIRVNVTHPFVGELGIELNSPMGTRSVLKNITDGYFNSVNLSNQVFLSNAFYGENPTGTWTIKVVDGFGLNTSAGTLTGWAIRVYGH